MSVKNAVNALEMTSIDSASMTGSYQAINASGLEKACFYLKIINDSNQDVSVSYDGSTDNDYVLSGTREPLPAQNYAQPNNWVSLFAKGTVVYVKGTAGTGNVYLVGYYVER